jgi:exopolyphosphatase/pppGpp-phosphohydrolase
MSRPGMEGLKAPSLSWFREWVFEQLGTIRHERRVSAICHFLFDLTHSWHGMKRSDLRLLKLAAYLHDIGRSVNNKNHPAEGARMIRQCEELPLKKRQRRLLAYIALRHRGRVPESGEDRALERINDRRKARLLLGLLRAADALDSRWMSAPRLTFSRRGQTIRIVCRTRHDADEARRIFCRRKKFRLLEEELGCRIEVVVRTRRRVRAAA